MVSVDVKHHVCLLTDADITIQFHFTSQLSSSINVTYARVQWTVSKNWNVHSLHLSPPWSRTCLLAQQPSSASTNKHSQHYAPAKQNRYFGHLPREKHRRWFTSTVVLCFFVTDLRVRFFVRKSLISEVWGLKQDENPDSGSVPR